MGSSPEEEHCLQVLSPPSSHVVQRVDRSAHTLEGQPSQVLRAGSRQVDSVAGLGYGVVGRTVLSGGLNPYGEQILGIYALAAPLSEVDGRRPAARQQHGDISGSHYGAGTHVDLIAQDVGKMAPTAFEYEPSVATGHHLHL